MKIGVFVGSFNPVHKGHIKIVNSLLKNKYLDKVLIIPTGNYWDKTSLIDIKYRIEMLKYYENSNIIIDTKHNNLEYTYQVMDELKKEYKNDKLYLIIGADNIVSFDKWKHYEDLLKNGLIIVSRNNIDIKSYLNKLNKNNDYYIVNEDYEVSSTIIRNNINNKKVLEEYLDKNIIDYINKNNLYK